MSARGATKVLIAGGGVAALEAALTLRDLAAEHVSVELLAPDPYFWYRPLAPAEAFSLGEAVRFELDELARAAGAAVALGALAAVDAQARVVHTSAGGEVRYDLLLVACGAVPAIAVEGATPFRGPADVDRVQALLADVATGSLKRLAYVVPWGATWPLPAYELALMTAARVESLGLDDVELSLVTPEEQPLEVFGAEASNAVAALLAERRIAFHPGTDALRVHEGELELVPQDSLAVDAAVALPRLRGPRIDGLPQTAEGFLPVDEHGGVPGLDDVYAAGDVTSFPVKQGGIAAQQAAAAAEAIAAAAGAAVTPRPFRPVLRGLLLTGRQPRYFRRELSAEPASEAVASLEPLWWPPAKIVGPRLAPFLAAFARSELPGEEPPPEAGLPVEVELDAAELRPPLPPFADVAAVDEERCAGDVMMRDPLEVAPEDTLGEVAERMRERDVGSAIVVDHGGLVGIVTSRDLLRAFAGRVHASEARAREWMTAEPVTVSPATPLDAAAELMARFGFHHLPVVEGGRAVGVLGLRQAVAGAGRLGGIGLGL